MKKRLICGLIAAMLIMPNLSGCGCGTPKDKNDNVNSATSGNDKEDKEKDKDKDSGKTEENKDTDKKDETGAKEEVVNFKIGEVATVKGVELKVERIEKSIGNATSKPADGTQFVIVTVNLKNTSATDVNYKFSDFYLKNSKGELIPAITKDINKSNALSNGTLKQNQQVNGSVLFEQSLQDDKFTLVYKSEINGDKVVVNFSFQ